MKIEQGQIWKIRILTRPDVEIVRYDAYSEEVHWRYTDSSNIFTMKKDSFLKDFEIKQ